MTSATTASVTVLIKSGETSTAYISARKAWISRTVIPRVDTPPVEGDVLGVFSAPSQRSTATITYQLRGDKAGKYANIAELTSSTFAGTNIVVAPVKVVER